MRAALDESLTELTFHLKVLREAGLIAQPWLGDVVSQEVQSHYNLHVMEAADGPYAALLAYEAELLKTRRALDQIEQEYIRTDGEHAANLGRI